MQSIMDVTRAEPGCVRFDLLTSPDQQTLYIDEIWADEAAFHFHHAQSYTIAVFKAYEAWLKQPPELIDLRAVVADPVKGALD